MRKKISAIPQAETESGPKTAHNRNDPPNDSLQRDTFEELQERFEKAKNIIMYNLEESKSTNTSERITYDKALKFLMFWGNLG